MSAIRAIRGCSQITAANNRDLRREHTWSREQGGTAMEWLHAKGVDHCTAEQERQHASRQAGTKACVGSSRAFHLCMLSMLV